MGFHIALFLFLAFLPPSLSQEVMHASILVHGNQAKAETDDNFIYATIDWWPHDKGDYDHCPWRYSSVTNLDLSHPFLAKAVQAKAYLDCGQQPPVSSLAQVNNSLSCL
ncbi:hypothetical protein K1719_009122 [Acacia pycnantha]|nr:hypothetical protein K1719_009122 [Acacia pycnantha]